MFVTLAASCLISLFFLTTPAVGATWDDRFFMAGPDGSCRTLYVDGDSLFVGGHFRGIGTAPALNIARFDGSRWSVLGPGIGGDVVAITRYHGELVAAGGFRTAGGQPAANIARWDGTVWHPLGAGTNGAVRALAVFDGDLIAGGDFASAGGAPAAGVARWDGSGWSPMGEELRGSVKSLAVFRGDLYAACQYPVYPDSGGSLDVWVSRWNGEQWVPVLITEHAGTWDPGPVRGLYVADDRLYAFGDELVMPYVSYWDGSVWNDYGGYGVYEWDDASCPAYALCTWRGKLVVGGSFYGIRHGASNGISMRDASGWVPVPGGGLPVHPGDYYPVPAVNGTIQALAEYHGRLIAGGDFGSIGGTPVACVAANDGSRWSPVSPLGQGIVGDVSAVAWLGGDLIVGGTISQAGDLKVLNVARWDGEAWHTFGVGVAGKVERLVSYRTGVVATGARLRAAAGKGITFWDGTSWKEMGASFDDSIADAVAWHGDLIVGGRFQHSGTSPTPYAARWDGHAWHAMPGLDGAVLTLTVYSDSVIAGGEFTGHLAAWDGTGWRPFRGGARDRIDLVKGIGRDLFVLGLFSFSMPNAWWDGTRWRKFQLEGGQAEIYSLGAYGGDILAGGRSSGGDTAPTLFIQNGERFTPFPGWPAGTVRALARHGSHLALGGAFTAAGSVSSWKLAILHDPALAEASGFSGKRTDQGALLTWVVTGNGVNARWNVYRVSAPDSLALVNEEPLTGSMSYRFVDREKGLLGGDYRLEQIDSTGASIGWYGPVHVDAVPAGPGIAAGPFRVLEVSPNPARGSVTLGFALPSDQPVRGVVFDLSGRIAARIPERSVAAGRASIDWTPIGLDGRPLSSGCYWVRLISPDATRTARVVLTR